MSILTREQLADTLEWLGLNHPDIPAPVLGALTILMARGINAGYGDITDYLTLFNQHWLLSHDQGDPDRYLDAGERACVPEWAWRETAIERTKSERDDYLGRVLKSFDERLVA